MKTIPLTPDTEALARRVVWFESPAEALSDTFRFVAYALERDGSSLNRLGIPKSEGF
jgi:hypothetical protein